MKQILCVMILVGSAGLAGGAQARNVYVPGHYLANGQYVPPHYEQVPDAPAYDNYPGYQNVDPNGNVAPPMPYPYGAPYAPAPYQAAPYMPAPGYVPNYGYGPR